MTYFANTADFILTPDAAPHAAQTGAHYSEHGQRLATRLIARSADDVLGIVAINDVDRHISGCYLVVCLGPGDDTRQVHASYLNDNRANCPLSYDAERAEYDALGMLALTL